MPAFAPKPMNAKRNAMSLRNGVMVEPAARNVSKPKLPDVPAKIKKDMMMKPVPIWVIMI